MKREYTRPEIVVTLFATESIMDSAVTDNDTQIDMVIDEELPGEIKSSTWNIN